MLVYMRGNITREEKKNILLLFKENIKKVVLYKNVPIKYRFVLGIFNLYPKFFRWLFETFYKVQTINE